MKVTIDLPVVVQAIRKVQGQIRWKPGKADTHLSKRKVLGHLPPQALLVEYEDIIRAIVHHPKALVYVYRYGPIDYPTVVARHQGQVWLVMVGPDGTMETAFPPDEPESYFSSDPRYIPIGNVEELML